MTGFGREEKLINSIKIVIEIRTLNSKGLDINLKVHESFSFIGEYLRKSVKEKLIKGKVDVILDIEDTNEDLLIPFNNFFPLFIAHFISFTACRHASIIN